MKSSVAILASAIGAVLIPGILGMGATRPSFTGPEASPGHSDTIIYPEDGYKLRRVLEMEAVTIADSLLDFKAPEEDTLPKLTARDTIKVPDSLKTIDPFRYKYYVALLDSLTHVQTRDSLLAVPDSAECFLLDSVYRVDSTSRARAAFLAWYNSLDKAGRKKYDLEQKEAVKMALMDSLKEVEAEKQAIRDSIIKFKPRILQTFALPDSMQYKRIIEWTLDDNFQKMDVNIPDTTFNYHYYDFPFQRNDVNATWLGEAGTPVQYYNFFKRKSDEEVDFYDALESWSFSPRTVKHFNTKTPYTELGYFGTLLAGQDKESDNLHLFTTQNITPEFNFHLLFDRYGTGGELQNSKVANKTASIGVNYLGKKYLMHAGFISNTVERGESGGIVQTCKDGTPGNFWVRDTTVEAREIRVALDNAASTVKKRTGYIDQQFRIPFNFIYRIKERRDSTFVFNPDSLDKDMATAFIGHSSEISSYSRTYTDKIDPGSYGEEFYTGEDGVYRYRYSPLQTNDEMGVLKLDNKVFLKLQPWKSESIVSNLNVGIGDIYRNYLDSTALRPRHHSENSVYAYAGAQGQFRNYISWDARANFTFAGATAGDFGVEADAFFNFFPFRRDRKSPVSFKAHFETSLKEPTYYQKHLSLNHCFWDNEFKKISTTKIEGALHIPRWDLDASAGYALNANTIYFGKEGIVAQSPEAVSVFSASLKKNLAFGPVHLDNQALLQVSSNQEVIPVPLLALNLRYYIQFRLGKDPMGRKVMTMQIGANGFYNTRWCSPAWNPNLGVFYNQRLNEYENGPYFDLFVNAQWKKACIFIKWFNVGNGWPAKHADYFTADHFIVPQRSISGLKFGILWPFYIPAERNPKIGSGR